MQKTLFNSGWRFSWGYNSPEGDMGLVPENTERVNLPHDWVINGGRSMDAASGRDTGFYKGGSGCYYKYLSLSAEQRNNTVMLEFEGVMQNADIYVNGHHVVTHHNGYSAFVVDITKFLNPDGRNLLKVAVTNPEGSSRWYTGGGIYRNVYLLTAGAIAFSPYGLMISTPEAYTDRSKVVAAQELQNNSKYTRDIVVRTTFYNPRGKKFAARKKKLKLKPQSVVQSEVFVKIKKAQLWSPESPFIYRAVSEIFFENKPDQIIDSIESTFGIRSLELVAGEGLLLNGTPIKLKGGNVHHDNGLLGAAAHPQAEERKVCLLKQAGFNAVRTAHNPPSTAFLDACDREGLMVVEEAFDVWEIGKRPLDYHIDFAKNWHIDLDAMIKRDRNHPSVIVWSLGNDPREADGSGDGYKKAAMLAGFVRNLDPTRAITVAVGEVVPKHSELEKLISDRAYKQNTQKTAVQKVAEYAKSKDLFRQYTTDFFKEMDIAGYNYLHDRYERDTEAFPERLIMGTESAVSQAFEAWQAVESHPNIVGDFVSTAIDYLGEAQRGEPENKVHFPARCAGCGEIDITGFRKPQSYYRSVLWGDLSSSMIVVRDPDASDTESTNIFRSPKVQNLWNFPRHVGKTLTVDVYTAGEVVALYLDGTLIGRRLAGVVNKFVASFELKYHPGKLTAVCFSKGEEVSRSELVTVGSPKGIRVETEKKTVVGEEGRLVYVDISVVDKENNVVPFADRNIRVELEGPAELIALGSGAMINHDDFSNNSADVHEGRLLAILRLTGDAGKLKVLCECDDLKKGKLMMNVK